ncbi:MAG: TonB-dependent receptor [Chitinophagaceae bacterium]
MKVIPIICLSILGGLLHTAVQAQETHVHIESVLRGTILDSLDKRPLEGVLVNIEGTTNQAFTDASGQFTIKTGQKLPYKISVSYVGYNPLQTAINDTVAQLLLSPKQDTTNDVVVIGYGTQRRRNLLGAQSTFDAKNIEEKPISRVEEALLGQVPGVQVRQQSGGLPGSGLSIIVRGSGSLSAGTEPLYVIDGFPLDIVSQSSDGSIGNSPLNNLNPNDIESIEVLKDAAAGAIYGSRAANGVVLITTKRGKVGQAKITLNANTGISSVAKKLDILSADEWVQVASAIADSNWVNSATGRTADQTQAERTSILGSLKTSYVKDDRWSEDGHPGLEYINWQDVIYHKALFQNYSLNASGGTKNVNYFITGNYMNQDGILRTSNYKTYGIRANVEAKASSKLKFGINLAPTYSYSNAPYANGKDNILMKASIMAPVVEDTAGLYTGAFNNYTYTWSSSKYVSPYAYLYNSYNKLKTTRILGSAYAIYDIIDGLSFKTSVNYDGYSRNTKTYVSDQVVAGAQTYRTTNPGLYSTGSYATILKQNFVNENIVTYDRTFKGEHHVNVVVGQSYNYVHTENSSIATAGGYANDIVETLNNAIANSSGATVTGSTSESNTALASFFGRLQYDYLGRYLLSGSLRRDGSSVFGSNNRWGTFPSLAIGYRISDEAFFKDNVSFVDDLKLRASWGQSGNNSITNYSTYSTLTDATYSFGGNDATSYTGQVSSGIANPNLKWETSNTYDLGFDISLLKRRVNISLDAYRKISSNLLMNLPVLAASGFTTSLQNIGKVKTEGLEIAVNTINIRSRNFSWSTNANIAFNGNKVLSLGPNQTSIEISSAYSGSNAPYLLKVGEPMFSYYITRVDGILTQDDINNSSVAKVSNETVGDAKYYDANGDASITSDDRIIYGHPNPNYTWGLTNTFTYKDFELSIQAYGQQGGKILSYLGRALDYSGSTTANILGVWRDRWTTENQNYNAKRGKLNASYTPPYVTSDWVYSSDFWRIQNITLGYTFIKNTNSKLFKSIKGYASVRNIFGKDKYDGGVNPEAQNTNNSGNTSYPLPGDYGAVPLSKTLTLGLNVNF